MRDRKYVSSEIGKTSIKNENTIYFEHLQKGEKKMSTKDWKNKEISTLLLAEAWGFQI